MRAEAAGERRAGASTRAAGGLAAAGVFLGGCLGLSGPPTGEPSLRPAVQHYAPNQVVGNTVVTSHGGVAISLEPLSREHLDALYENRPGLVSPLKGLPSEGPPPVVFRVSVRNRGRQAVQMEPAQFILRDQDGRQASPLGYQDFYQLLADLPDGDRRLRSVQATTLSTFLSVPPGGEREGFVYFPPVADDARLVLLELSSLYLGAREVPLLAEFEVVRPKGAPTRR